MSLDGALAIAISGLGNINRSIAVVSQNVANASTPDYSREVAVQTSATAAGMGMGVRTQPAIRQVNAQLQDSVFQVTASLSGLQVRRDALQRIDAVQGKPGDGTDLASKVGALQDAFSALQNDPSNQTQQSAVILAAKAVSDQINTLSVAYQTGRQTAQDALGAGVRSLNDAVAQIGSLTNEIVSLRALSLSTADIENQRDAAKDVLSQLISLRYVDQPNGDLQVFSANGLSVPLHSSTPPFAVASATIDVSTYYPGPGVPAITLNGVDVTTQLGAGQLGAQVTLRDATLPTDQAELDEFAQALSTRFDQQGLRLFSDPTGAVPVPTGPLVQSGYVGYANIIAVNPAVVATPSLVRDGTQAITGSSAGATSFTPNPAGGPVGFSGLVQRVLANTFGTEVQPGVAQPPLAQTMLGGGGTLGAPYVASGGLVGCASALVAAQSQDSAATGTDLTNDTALQTTLQGKLASASGVSIDTEMSNMVALQNAYGANAKIIGTLQAMFNAVLDMVH